MTLSSSPDPIDTDPTSPDPTRPAATRGLRSLGRRANATALSLTLVAACAALWVSPVGGEVSDAVADRLPPALGGTAGERPATARPTPSPSSATPSARPSATPTPAPSAVPVVPVVDRGAGSGSTAGGGTVRPVTDGSTSSGGTSGTTARGTRVEGCWSFRWQQDAQAYYVSDLSDPLGLDSGKGGYDGDGVACTDLPVDPRRPASEPAGAYVAPAPTPASKRELVSPARAYYGFSQDGLPGDTAMLDRLDAQVGKAPSSVGWFSGFNQDYRGDLVTKAWRRDALPVVTWMSVAQVSDPTAVKPSYSLSSIVDGKHDAYLYRYAEAVKATGLPVAIRFDHEMNGSWYGWSAGRTDYNNTPEKYVAAWRHLWQVFESVGANDEVIWLWSPSRVDDLRPSATNGITDLEASYPGDQYVDWVGASVYLRRAALGSTYEASFGRTVGRLKALTDKPLFFAEIGATQAVGGTDLTALKAAWTTTVIARLARDEDVVGFLWFNNAAAHVVDGVPTTLDWTIDSSAEALAAFRTAVAGDEFAAGTRP